MLGARSRAATQYVLQRHTLCALSEPQTEAFSTPNMPRRCCFVVCAARTLLRSLTSTLTPSSDAQAVAQGSISFSLYGEEDVDVDTAQALAATQRVSWLNDCSRRLRRFKSYMQRQSGWTARVRRRVMAQGGWRQARQVRGVMAFAGRVTPLPEEKQILARGSHGCSSRT